MDKIKRGCLKLLIWILVFIIIVLVAAGIGAGAVYMWQRSESEKARQQSESEKDTLNQQINDLKTQLENLKNNGEVPVSSPTGLGTIEGSLSYPSSFIPRDMKVCAQTLDGAKKYCTADHIKDSKYTSGEGYKLSVPAGTYQVYAYITKTDGTDWKAFYNKFVTCGLAVTCTSHEKINVEVKVGATVTNIDPQDWYESI